MVIIKLGYKRISKHCIHLESVANAKKNYLTWWFIKQLLSVLLIIIFTVFPLNQLIAQSHNANSKNMVSISDIARNLRNLNFISEETYQQIQFSMTEGEIPSRSMLLDELAQEARKRRLSPDFPKLFRVAIVFEPPTELTEEMRLELLQLLHGLKQSGVITERVYQRLETEVKASYIKMDIDLFQQAENQMRVYENLQLKDLEPHLKTLRSSSILSADGYTKLIQDIQAENIASNIQLFKYFNNAVIFDLKDYSKKLYEYLPTIYQCIVSMLHQSGIANIKIDSFSIDEPMMFSIYTNRRKYQYNLYPVIKNEFSIPIADTREFFFLFNKILRDMGSSYRLYDIGVVSDQLIGLSALENSNTFGFIALTNKQFKLFLNKSYIFNLNSFNEQEKELTTNRIEEVIVFLGKIGLLNHLTPQQINVNKENIRQSYITNYYQLLQVFDTFVPTIDLEANSREDSYKRLIHKFANVSRGNFAPTDILFEWKNNQTAEVSFKVNGKIYSTKLESKDDLLDVRRLFSLILQVVDKTVSNGGRFYPLYNGHNYITGYIFLTNEQRRLLEFERLVVLSSPTN
ncbi:MAG: hypothetical protein V7K53_15355 [Nostoc sp.]|uniref:hypothetical protein n=1 Tax=Nostoc sp. TaxID=1180 RepID=UPI002FFC2463